MIELVAGIICVLIAAIFFIFSNRTISYSDNGRDSFGILYAFGLLFAGLAIWFFGSYGVYYCM